MWLPHPIRLDGRRVRLEPISEAHIPELVRLGADKEIWQHLPTDGSEEGRLSRELRTAILNRAQGTQYAFTVFAKKADGREAIIGSTRLFDLFPDHKKLEIGWTWYGREAWGGGYNTECKLLLLTFCFETLRCNRVQLKTRTTNLRSRAAIEKIGAAFEGILRADRVMPDGTVRDTVVYSIILPEWPTVKARLEELVAARTD